MLSFSVAFREPCSIVHLTCNRLTTLCQLWPPVANYACCVSPMNMDVTVTFHSVQICQPLYFCHAIQNARSYIFKLELKVIMMTFEQASVTREKQLTFNNSSIYLPSLATCDFLLHLLIFQPTVSFYSDLKRHAYNFVILFIESPKQSWPTFTGVFCVPMIVFSVFVVKVWCIATEHDHFKITHKSFCREFIYYCYDRSYYCSIFNVLL